MKLAVGSDERTSLTDYVLDELRKRAHEVNVYGPMAGKPMGWPEIGEKIGLEVSSGTAEQGIVFCWTGTGVCIAANKVPRVRAALCRDAETSRGARLWDDANVLAMSLRSTSPAIAKEILDSWFSNQPIQTGIDAEMISKAKELDSKYRSKRK